MKALSLNLREAAQGLLDVLKSRSHPRAMNAREILDAVSAASPGVVADVLASSINISTDQKLVRVCVVVVVVSHVQSLLQNTHAFPWSRDRAHLTCLRTVWETFLVPTLPCGGVHLSPSAIYWTHRRM